MVHGASEHVESRHVLPDCQAILLHCAYLSAYLPVLAPGWAWATPAQASSSSSRSEHRQSLEPARADRPTRCTDTLEGLTCQSEYGHKGNGEEASHCCDASESAAGLAED